MITEDNEYLMSFEWLDEIPSYHYSPLLLEALQ